ncbi:MAG TPA: amidase, partial [Acidimicrobiales bacterium]|nr:amidase [Acidimicrobiales bacterium]
TADSAVLEGNTAARDATVWARLSQAGMVLVGHLHCGELAYGHWGVNPWRRDLSPGGSSSGSAIALAARLVPATIGTDTRGSIRMPAAFTGVSAVKPTFGLVSTAGCIPLSFSYDVVGPMARSAADCALLLEAMAGPDELDRLTLSQPSDRSRLGPSSRSAGSGGGAAATAPLGGLRPLSGVRLGVPDLTERLSPGVASVFERFAEDLRRLGAECVAFAWPENPLEVVEGDGVPGWLRILGTEASVIHEQFAARRHLHRDEFRSLFLPMMRSSSGADYLQAQMARQVLADCWSARFAELEIDAVLHPASTSEPYRADEDVTAEVMKRLLFGVWNDTGFPVVSLPAGLSPLDGSPVGVQLAGLPFSERSLLQIAAELQAATGYHLASPAGLDDARPFVAPSRPEAGAQPPYVGPPSPFDTLHPLARGAVDTAGDLRRGGRPAARAGAGTDGGPWRASCGVDTTVPVT